MNLKRIKKKILLSIGNRIAGPIINVLCKTLRIKENNKSSIDKIIDERKNVIFAFWHGTMIIPWYILRRFKPSTIVSLSNDGNLLANVLQNWNYQIKRGSSSREGKKVLEDLIVDAKNNKTIAITPDGPKGPKYVMKAGAVIIAKKSQIPLVLIGIGIKSKIRLNSWDQLKIPYIFSRVTVNYSDPIFIDENLSYEETDNMIQILSERLRTIQKKAELN